jgi:tRNA A37 N6-isopentenylltransferase MiaA
MKRPQRADRYEAQLTDAELTALHGALMGGKQTLEKIRAAAPPWRDGAQKGKTPSMATLSNIRDRLVMEETFRANEQTTEAILAQVAEEDPQLPKDRLDEIGQRLFKTLSIRQLDVNAWVQLQKAEKATGDLKLARERFEVEVAEKLLDEVTRRRVDEIAENKSLSEVDRINAIRKVYFADVDALQASGAVQIPAP